MPRTSPKVPEFDPEAVRIGATIRAMREMRGMTQDELSQGAVMSRSYVANTESGRYKPSAKAIARIATALRVSQISIIARTDDVEAVA